MVYTNINSTPPDNPLPVSYPFCIRALCTKERERLWCSRCYYSMVYCTPSYIQKAHRYFPPSVIFSKFESHKKKLNHMKKFLKTTKSRLYVISQTHFEQQKKLKNLYIFLWLHLKTKMAISWYKNIFNARTNSLECGQWITLGRF